jgi:phage tail tape-measure protein
MAEKENEQIGSVSGILAGGLAGAALGTTVLPVVGTFVGALGGAVLGSQVGRTVGGAILNSLDPSSTSAPAAPTEDVIGQLERLGKLREQGLITEEEFAAAKAKILGL